MSLVQNQNYLGLPLAPFRVIYQTWSDMFDSFNRDCQLCPDLLPDALKLTRHQIVSGSYDRDCHLCPDALTSDLVYELTDDCSLLCDWSSSHSHSHNATCLLGRLESVYSKTMFTHTWFRINRLCFLQNESCVLYLLFQLQKSECSKQRRMKVIYIRTCQFYIDRSCIPTHSHAMRKVIIIAWHVRCFIWLTLSYVTICDVNFLTVAIHLGELEM